MFQEDFINNRENICTLQWSMNGSCCFVSAGLGNTAPTAQCAAGYYCPGGQESSTPSGLECFAGHYCPQGSNYPIMCDNGTYQVNPGQDSCLTCPAGYFCDAASGKKNKNPATINGIL